MNNVLRIESERIALEAGLSLDLPQLLQHTLPSITAGFAKMVGRFSPDIPAVPLTGKEQDFMREVLKHTYLDITPIAAYVPEGMNVPYMKYLRALQPAVKHATHDVPKHVGEFSMFLSQLVTSSQQELSTVSFKRENDASAKQRKLLNQNLGRCFQVGSTRAERTIGDVVDRNSDWAEVLKENAAIVEMINTVDRQALNKKIAACSELLQVLMDKIGRGELKNVTPQTVTNIADGAYAVAEEIEFYAAVHFHTLAMAESVRRTTAHFMEVFKK